LLLDFCFQPPEIFDLEGREYSDDAEIAFMLNGNHRFGLRLTSRIDMPRDMYRMAQMITR